MSDERPLPPMYFSLRTVQPFAEMSLREVEGEPGVEVTMLRRLEIICEKAGIDPLECWRRVRGDVDLAVRVREKIRK